jgi:arsenate reductase
MESMLCGRLETLSHPPRMAVFRLLMRRFPDAVPAGEIATALSLKPNTTSVYLSALLQSGLVRRTRHGTSRLYTLDLASTQDMVAELFGDCCRGRPDLCPPGLLQERKVPMVDHKFNVLFICTGNSASFRYR